ncbi:hypothetical protein Ade02nite_80820 [Paractinoplanes deccanensis]|uniref:Sel1 repeat family protein n=1 Tax=Paractinoplanes deccanensis TaxID=113561 RepID=A0ABQ3YHG4_9ACTN|nr:hypothetical protein [Actinoplanes deccanensis]GID79441.1 hypothetical protein Ade02nite_80820 [Actinoplanes deccanensis]
MTNLDEIAAAATELSRAGRWQRALSLLDSVPPPERERLALTAAETALECDWYTGTALAEERLAAARQAGGPSWDLDFLVLRHDYFRQLSGDSDSDSDSDSDDSGGDGNSDGDSDDSDDDSDGDSGGDSPTPVRGPDAQGAEALRDRAAKLAVSAEDETRRGWAEMYRGLIADNLLGAREAAPRHYEAAHAAGEAGDDLLLWEALRHLGDHDRDNGDLASARDRWQRAAAIGARAGLVPRTLSQQMLLAVLARDEGDEAGAARLAAEIARWTQAIGAHRLHTQATSFLAGAAVV